MVKGAEEKEPMTLFSTAILPSIPFIGKIVLVGLSSSILIRTTKSLRVAPLTNSTPTGLYMTDSPSWYNLYRRIAKYAPAIVRMFFNPLSIASNIAQK